MPAFTQPFNLTVGSTIPAPFGVSLGTGLGDGAGASGSVSNHWNAVKSGMGLTPKVLTAVGVNAFQDFGEPNTWGGDSGNWGSGNGIPTNGTVFPLLTYHPTNGTNSNVDFAGVIAGNYDTKIQNSLALWKGITGASTIYMRINWEFNTTFANDQQWPIASNQVTNWVNMWRRWANVAHTWGNNNGVRVRMVWSPDTSYSFANSQTFNQPVVNFFPLKDANAVNGRYIDVIGSDIYMGGYGVFDNFGQTTSPLSTTTVWSLGTFVALAQNQTCNIAVSETGDGSGFDNNNSWQDGTMANFANYLNTLKTLVPVVPIEYISQFDVTIAGASQFFINTSGFGNMAIAYRSMLGLGGNGSIPTITTTATI